MMRRYSNSNYKKCTVSLLLILLSSQPILAQKQKADFAELEKAALQELQETNTPGAAIAVISGDRIVLAKGFGVANVETGAPVSPDMLFHIGSLTKLFTASALVILAEEGKIKLDAPIANYARGLSPRLARVTAHELLSQTSGIKDQPGDYGLHDETALADYARSLTDDYSLIGPGKAFSYSNPGFALAGYVIEQVSGRPFADQMNEVLFKPLGLSRTVLRPTEAITYPLATGHKAQGQERPTVVRPLADDTRLWPAGYIFSTLNDLSRFVIALLNVGKVDGKQVLPPSLVTKLFTPHIDIPTNVFEEGKYGYGLFIHKYRGLQVFEHGGSLPGYSCELRIVPDHRFAIITLINKDGGRLSKTIDKALELMLPVKAKAEPSPVQSLQMSEEEMAGYVGSYSNRWAIEILMRDGKLFLKQFGTELPISKVSGNRFTVTPPGARQSQEFLMVQGADGKIEYLQMFIWVFRRL
jgi:CubicO group peptidase (beta-lactamase class C family)